MITVSYTQNLDMHNECFVYWLYDNTCTNIEQSGYIGASANIEARVTKHKLYNRNIPLDFKCRVIFSGTREECFKEELRLRPTNRIGWNVNKGGQGYINRFGHTKEAKNKMKEAWTEDRKLKASEATIERNKSMLGQKRISQSIRMSGEANPMYGKTHSEEARSKISAANIGKLPWNKQDIYCIYCRTKVSKSIAIKYHGLNRKNCISIIEYKKLIQEYIDGK